jgi:hypothetical protein
MKGVLFSFGYIVLVALKHFAHVSRVVIHRDELGGRHHAADIARTAARQLAAKARVLDEVAEAEAAGFTVQEDFSVIDSPSGSSRSTTEADNHAAAIQAAVTDLITLDKQAAARLDAAADRLRDLTDN